MIGIRDLLYLVKVLYRETAYLMIKSTRPAMSPREVISRSKWMWTFNILLAVIVTLGLSLLLVIVFYIPIPGRVNTNIEDLLRSTALSYIGYIFLFSFMISTTTSWILQEYDLVKPIKSLPLSEGDIRILVLLTISVGSIPVLIMPLIYSIGLAIRFSSIIVFLTALFYGVLTFLLATGIPLILTSHIGAKRFAGSSLRINILRALNTLIYVLSMSLTYILWQLLGRINSVLKYLTSIGGGLRYLTESLLSFVYPLSVCEGIVSGATGDEMALYHFALSLIYLYLAYRVFKIGSRRYWRALLHPEYIGVELVKPIKRIARWTLDPKIGLMIKDFKMIYRNPRSGYLFFFPLIYSIFFMISMREFTVENLAFLTLFSVTMYITLGFLVSYVPYQLLLVEGDNLWVLFANGIRKRDIAIGKSLPVILQSLIVLTLYGYTLLPMGVPAIISFISTGALYCTATTIIVSTIWTRTIGPETRMLKMSIPLLLLTLLIQILMAIPHIIVSLPQIYSLTTPLRGFLYLGLLPISALELLIAIIICRSTLK